jgi:hypothetical protein
MPGPLPETDSARIGHEMVVWVRGAKFVSYRSLATRR